MSRREPPGPGEPGYDEGQWTGFALDVGLLLASTFGLGLSLFNALRTRFEGVSQSILGQIASTIGQAVRAATGLKGYELTVPPVLDDLPIVPASWHPGEPEDRIVAAVDVGVVAGAGMEGEMMRTWVNGLEILTPEELVSIAQGLASEALKASPRRIKEIQAEIANLVFLAKRY